MDFDVTAGVMCVIIALTSGFIIYGVAKITIKGYSSYDDVKASRRQEKTRPSSNDRSSEAKKLKKIKKKLKKESYNSALPTNNAADSTPEEEISLSPQEEFIETPPITLIQKIEEKPVQISKAKTKVKPPKKMEEPELTNNSPSKQSEPAYDKVTDCDFTKTECKLIAEAIVSLENDISNNSVDEESPASLDYSSKVKKKTKKKKTDSPLEESGKLTLQSLLPLLKQAEFSHGEVQILIDALLNKDESEWLKGKQDPMLKLKKQLMEMEKLHAGDAETINGLQVRLTSLRSELNSEKCNNKTLRDALTKTNNDSQSFSIKLQQMAEEKESLLLNIQQIKQQLNEEHMLVLKLKEEKLLYSQMNISHEQHHEAVVGLQAQVSQLAAQLADQQTHNANLAAQLDEAMRVEEECRQVNALNVDLDHLLNNSQFEVNRLNSELVALSKQLEESRSQISDLSIMLEAIDAKKNEALVENENLKVEVNQAKQDARTYQKMADTLEHNLEENRKNGNISFHDNHSNCQSLLDEKDLLIENLNTELNQKEKLVDKLTNDIISCKNDANKKQTLVENLSVELSSIKALGVKTSADLNEERSIASSLQATIAEKNEIINNLIKKTESYKLRNNELRSKNWKIVEALEKAEFSIKDLSSRTNNTSVDSSNVTVMKCRINRLIEPLISASCKGNISNIEDTELWLEKVEEIISNVTVNKESNNTAMTAQNVKLQNLVTHYRSVITDLEAMLLDLQLKLESADNNQKSSGSSSHQEVENDD